MVMKFKAWSAAIVGAALAAVLAGAFALVARGTLGAVIGALAVVSMVAPQMVAGEERVLRRVVVAISVLVGVALGLIVAAARGSWGLWGWLQVTIVVASYGLALAAVCDGLERIRVNASIAAGVTTVLSVLWLSWPFWMAPWMEGGKSEELASRMALVHPVFAANGSMIEVFPPWAEQRIAYRQTNLGDDILYEMPRTISWCVGMNLGVVLLGLVLHGRDAHATVGKWFGERRAA